MLQLDLDRLEEDAAEFLDYTKKVIDEIPEACLIMSIIQLANDLTDSFEEIKETVEKDDKDKALQTLVTHVILLTQFWLLNKDTFKKIDRILDHSDNLPMRIIEET